MDCVQFRSAFEDRMQSPSALDRCLSRSTDPGPTFESWIVFSWRLTQLAINLFAYIARNADPLLLFDLNPSKYSLSRRPSCIRPVGP